MTKRTDGGLAAAVPVVAELTRTVETFIELWPLGVVTRFLCSKEAGPAGSLELPGMLGRPCAVPTNPEPVCLSVCLSAPQEEASPTPPVPRISPGATEERSGN